MFRDFGLRCVCRFVNGAGSLKQAFKKLTTSSHVCAYRHCRIRNGISGKIFGSLLLREIRQRVTANACPKVRNILGYLQLFYGEHQSTNKKVFDALNVNAERCLLIQST